jgi:hypothetical protein
MAQQGPARAGTAIAMQQLDIFNHSHDVMLRNDVLLALTQRDAAAAHAARSRLQAEFADDTALPALATLIEALGSTPPQRLALPADADARRQALEQRVGPAARSVWPEAEAVAWLAPLWAALARAATALPFDACWPGAHAAGLWLRAGEPAEAIAAATGIASWRRIPQPLAWMTEARWRADGLDAAWPLLAELAWLAPDRLDPLFKRMADPLVERLRKAFGARFEGDGPDDMAWFPAWVLTDKPALAGPMQAAEPGQHREPEQGFRLLVALLELERQGRHADVIERRKRLMALHAGLYRAYMQSR